MLGSPMRKLSVRANIVLAIAVALSATLSPIANAQYIETDGYTVRRLKHDLVSGNEFYYPAEAVRLKMDGDGRFAMDLLPNGKVESVRTLDSTGHALLDNYVKRTLLSYRFRPGTKGPVLFPVRFMLPNSRIQMW
jgi:TonB family protein